MYIPPNRVKIPGIPPRGARLGGGGSAIISATINPTVEFLIEDLKRIIFILFFFYIYILFPPFPGPSDFPPVNHPLATPSSCLNRCRVINFMRHRII